MEVEVNKKIKAVIEISEKEVKNCKDCRFYIHASTNMGRTSYVKCSVTLIGDSECDNSGEEQRIIKIMRKECPFAGKL